MTVHDDGGGPALHVAGSFESMGGVPANRVAKWDGTSWPALGDGIDAVQGAGITLASHDDGSGSALYAGGEFTTAGGAVASHVAKWDGASWSPLGTGLDGVVFALAVFDDGGGPALHAGGTFTSAGGVAASNVARWDGTSWTPLGSGANNGVNALAVAEIGGVSALYAGGHFTTAGGASARRVARWNGASWSPLGSGTSGNGGTVYSLAASSAGGSTRLYAGGVFTGAGGVAASRLARWDGSSWSALESGTDGTVHALASWDDGSGPALHAGGEFLVSPAGDSYLAKWGCKAKETVKGRKL